MKKIHTPLRSLIAATLATLLWAATPASAFEAHNLIEPPFGSFHELGALTIDQTTGRLFAGELEPGEVKVFEPGGGASSSIIKKTASLYEGLYPRGIAVDPISHAVYAAAVGRGGGIQKYELNGAGEYEYKCLILYYASASSRCLPEGGEEAGTEGRFAGTGVAVDSAGDVYVTGSISLGPGEYEGAVFEFNAAGEGMRTFALPTTATQGTAEGVALSVAPDGTIYALVVDDKSEASEVLELERSSLSGPAEGAPQVIPHTEGAYYDGQDGAKGIAFDAATGQLFVDLGDAGEALNEAHEVVSRFGTGVLREAGSLAVDEATGEVYVANGFEQRIDRFGPGVVAALPTVDAPPPTAADVTRTSALLSATIATNQATTIWQVEYVDAGEYQPAAASPYADGGSTPQLKLAAGPAGVVVGPVALSGLLAGTTYDYRLVASNELGTTYGQNHTFTTSAATPPAAITGAAGEITQTGVLLTGTLDTQELQTSYEFEVGTDTTYGGAKLFGNAGNGGTVTVSAGLQYLIPDTTYHYRLLASNEDGTTYGQDMTFTTPGVAPGVQQPPALVLIASPTVQFPSVAGAITKGHGAGKSKSKRKTKAKKRSKRKTPARKRRKGKKAAGRHA